MHDSCHAKSVPNAKKSKGSLEGAKAASRQNVSIRLIWGWTRDRIAASKSTGPLDISKIGVWSFGKYISNDTLAARPCEIEREGRL